MGTFEKCDRAKVSHGGLWGKCVPSRGTGKKGEHCPKVVKTGWGLEHQVSVPGLVLDARGQRLALIMNPLVQHEEFKLIGDLEPSCWWWAVLPCCNRNIRFCFINCFEGYNMCSFQLLNCPFRTFISTNEFNYFKYRSKIFCGMKIYDIIRLLMKTLAYLCVIEKESLTVSKGWC